jgi:uncharacterized protein YfaS (alpha-2-macroglobulin family)
MARDSRGLVVQRWYERLTDGRPVLAVAAGELVRVRLRVTAPADREFVAVEDPLPAGLEPVDLELRTSATLAPFAPAADGDGAGGDVAGRGWWGGSPWEHTEQRDDAVRWFARRLGAGTYALSYVARATTAGGFARLPAHAEEMYNPALQGRTEGGRFLVRDAGARATPGAGTPATLPP